MRTFHNIVLIAVILSSFLFGASTLTRGHEWGDDFASYLMQAQSILDGNTDEFIEHNTFTIFESSFQIGPVAYPWGYPLILTPALFFKGLHPLALKLPALFLFSGFLISLYLLAKKRLSSNESLLLISLFAFNPMLIKFLDQILSDIPLLFFTVFALLCILEFENKQTRWSNVLTGIVLFFAFFVRTTGIILLASFLAYQAFSFYSKKEKRKGVFINSIQTLLSFSTFWFVTSILLPNGQGSYFEQVKDLTFTILLGNIFNYYYIIGSFFGNGPAWTYLYYVFVIFFAAGIWVRRNADLLLIIFFFTYFASMIFWPAWQGIRFAFPLLPIFVYFVFQGLRLAIERLPEKTQKFGWGLSFVFWVFIVITFISTTGTQARTNLKNDRKINGPFDSYSDEVFRYIQTETEPDNVIVFFKPRAMRLFTGRDSIMILECENILKGDYFVQHLKQEYSQILPDDIDACNLPLENVFENQRFIVFKVSN